MLGLAAAAIGAAPASAAEVHVGNGAVVYTAAPGEPNDLSVGLNQFEGRALVRARKQITVTASTKLRTSAGAKTETQSLSLSLSLKR